MLWNHLACTCTYTSMQQANNKHADCPRTGTPSSVMQRPLSYLAAKLAWAVQARGMHLGAISAHIYRVNKRAATRQCLTLRSHVAGSIGAAFKLPITEPLISGPHNDFSLPDSFSAELAALKGQTLLEQLAAELKTKTNVSGKYNYPTPAACSFQIALNVNAT